MNNLDQYYLNEVYKHEEREKEDFYKVYLLFSSSGEWLWSDTELERIALEPNSYVGWIWNIDFDHYNPEVMKLKMERI